MKFLSLLFLLVLSSCSNLFFQPDRYQHYAPEQMGMKYQNIYFPAKDRTRLHSWLFSQDQKKGLVVLFHGNAQNLSSHFLSAAWLVRHGYDVWVWDYRGYGLSQGEASTDGVYQDSLAALIMVQEIYKKRDYEKLILIGQSLGGNILMRALEDTKVELPINLLILDSTFSSYRSMARSKVSDIWFLWPLQPLAWSIVSDSYSGKDSVESISSPTLIIHSKGDPIVPYKFGKEIYDRLKVKKKWLWAMEGSGHISTLGNPKSKSDKKVLELIESN